MEHFRRRGFLQLLGAAGLAPLLPSLLTQAVAATGKVSASKALWASLYAQAGSAPKFVDVARKMGLSNTAIQGVSARTLGVRVSLAATSHPLTRMSPADTPKVPAPLPREQVKASGDMFQDLQAALPREKDELPMDVGPEAENMSAKSLPEEPDGSTP